MSNDSRKTTKATEGKGGHTPVMRQFFRAKERYPDSILFFRMGDFYEMFYEDAVVVAADLELTLTSRSKGPDGERIPMAGVPHHAAQGYIAELLSRGHKVAICEQMADPATVKGVVPRDVVRVITPGLCLEPGALDARTHNYLLAVCVDDDAFAYAALELTTSELRVGSAPHRDALLSALWRFEPREVLVLGQSEFRDVVAKALPRAAVRIDAGADGDKLDEALARALATDDAQNTALQAGQAERRALGAVVRYAAEAEPQRTIRFERLLRDDASASFVLDAPAVQNLEILRTLGGDRKGSLLHLVDHTVTAMGARLLRERLLAPSA
ncbi:MAG: DNA mismatch repair protein MutS, partial [Myxococcales bacterium]|nr:DNA mismatch repair protein MutS [Myxococcales bacterium]